MPLSPPRPAVVRALVRREYLISRSYRAALVLDVFFGLVNLLIYYFISRTFGGGPKGRFSGAQNYFAFAAVGIALGLVVQVAAVRIAQRLREEQLTGTLEALVAQPITTIEMALGLSIYDIALAMGRATIYVLAASLFPHVSLARADWLGFALVIVAAGASVAPVGMAVAAAVLVLRRAEFLGVLVTLALTMIGGAFFPVSVLPSWLSWLARIVPTRFAFDGVRHSLFLGRDWGTDVLALVGLTAVTLPLALALFSAALAYAKKRGTLSTY